MMLLDAALWIKFCPCGALFFDWLIYHAYGYYCCNFSVSWQILSVGAIEYFSQAEQFASLFTKVTMVTIEWRWKLLNTQTINTISALSLNKTIVLCVHNFHCPHPTCTFYFSTSFSSYKSLATTKAVLELSIISFWLIVYTGTVYMGKWSHMYMHFSIFKPVSRNQKYCEKTAAYRV